MRQIWRAGFNGLTRMSIDGRLAAVNRWWRRSWRIGLGLLGVAMFAGYAFAIYLLASNWTSGADALMR